MNIIEPPAGPVLKLPGGTLLNTVAAARECLFRLAAWGNGGGIRSVTLREAGRLLGLNIAQVIALMGEQRDDRGDVRLTTLWRYVEWVRAPDVHQDVCRQNDGETAKRVRLILPGRVHLVPWRGGAYCLRYEDALLWRKFARLSALAGKWAAGEIGLEMMLKWARLPAVEAAVLVMEAAGWARHGMRSRGGHVVAMRRARERDRDKIIWSGGA